MGLLGHAAEVEPHRGPDQRGEQAKRGKQVFQVARTSTAARWKTETDDELIEIGGRWDRRIKRWAGEARRVRVIRVHRGQEESGAVDG